MDAQRTYVFLHAKTTVQLTMVEISQGTLPSETFREIEEKLLQYVQDDEHKCLATVEEVTIFC